MLALFVALAVLDSTKAETPRIYTQYGGVYINTTDEGNFVVNGIDLIETLSTQQSQILSQQSQIEELTQFKTDSMERLRILELSQSPTASPIKAPTGSPVSSEPTSSPTSSPTPSPTKSPRAPPPDGSSPFKAGISCFTLWQSGQRTDGDYWVSTVPGISPRRISCDMKNGGFNIESMERVIDVGGRHQRQQTIFKASDFAFSDNYKFGRVVVNYKFAGELDDSNNYVRSYFNNRQVSRYRNGRCNSGFVQVSGWPRTENANAKTFVLASRPEGDVDARCGSIPSHGRNYFAITKFQLVPL